MLKVLLKKQLFEVFKGFFYDAKKNRMRSNGVIALWIIFYAFLLVVILGGMFTMMAFGICLPLANAGVGWMYFLVMVGISILLGAFGSVFNTYSSLYLSKDNDLLLSLPIPVRTIMVARLMNVYLLGTVYASTVMIPTLLVYWVMVGITIPNFICGLLLYLMVTMIVLLLSCILGWVVAKISIRLKNKSFMIVLIALVCIALYYVIYFKASELISSLIANAEDIGGKIKGAAYVLYLFGRIGEGDFLATLIYLAVNCSLFALVWFVMTRTFLKIATSVSTVSRVNKKEKAVKQKSAFKALLGKEFRRFTSSANYMLNSGFTILMIPVLGVLLLIRGTFVYEIMNELMIGRPGAVAVILCGILCLLTSMSFIATPSVSLEGKSIWIPQSMPVSTKKILRAKMIMHLILTGVPVLFSSICAAIVAPESIFLRIMILLTSMTYVLFSALFNTFLAVKMPMMNWTSEIYPLKQGGAVAIAMFGGMGFIAVFIALYFIVGFFIGPLFYLLAWTIIFVVLSVLLLHWLDTKGCELFDELS